jgi:FMN phosphatase YigB (HAD superfamily)
VTSRALEFAFASTGVSLPGEQARQLTGLYDELPPFPDAVPALRALAGLGYELAVFSTADAEASENEAGDDLACVVAVRAEAREQDLADNGQC